MYKQLSIRIENLSYPTLSLRSELSVFQDELLQLSRGEREILSNGDDSEKEKKQKQTKEEDKSIRDVSKGWPHC